MKNRLKVLRAERDWTRADLAAALEVSRQTINAIEKEKFDPGLPLNLAAPPGDEILVCRIRHWGVVSC
ncbi:helix-turn-helix transcriptional regulator, partial [Pseudomonadota bacterium]